MAKKSSATKLLWFNRRATIRRHTAVHEANRQSTFAATKLGTLVCDSEMLVDIIDMS